MAHFFKKTNWIALDNRIMNLVAFIGVTNAHGPSP